MKRAQLAAICLALAISPAAVLADSLRSTGSVGMQATVIEACTISLRDLGAAAAEGLGGLATFGCGERVEVGAWHDVGIDEADARAYRVSYEREADGRGGAVATIIF